MRTSRGSARARVCDRTGYGCGRRRRRNPPRIRATRCSPGGASRTSGPSRPPGRRGPLARDPGADAGCQTASRRGAEDDIVLADFGRTGFRGLVRRGPGVRPGAVAAGRGPARGRSRPAGRRYRTRRGVGAQRAAFATAARHAPLAVVLHRPAIPPRPGGGEGIAGERGHRTLRDDPGPALRPACG